MPLVLVRAGATARKRLVRRVRLDHAVVMPPSPEVFAWSQTSTGDVRITHHGRHATTLRGRRAADFLDDVERVDPQELMARVTGNYKRGNERTARNHPRNR